MTFDGGEKKIHLYIGYRKSKYPQSHPVDFFVKIFYNLKVKHVYNTTTHHLVYIPLYRMCSELYSLKHRLSIKNESLSMNHLIIRYSSHFRFAESLLHISVLSVPVWSYKTTLHSFRLFVRYFVSLYSWMLLRLASFAVVKFVCGERGPGKAVSCRRGSQLIKAPRCKQIIS